MTSQTNRGINGTTKTQQRKDREAQQASASADINSLGRSVVENYDDADPLFSQPSLEGEIRLVSAKLVKLGKEQAAAAVTSRQELYQIIGSVYGALAPYIMTRGGDAEEDEKRKFEYLNALRLRQIPAAGPDENPFRPGVRMFFGVFDANRTLVKEGTYKGLIKFNINKSAEKYAGAMRWLRDNNIMPQDAAGVIEHFNGKDRGLRGVGNGLSGMVAADQQRNQQPPKFTEEEALRRAENFAAENYPVIRGGISGVEDSHFLLACMKDEHGDILITSVLNKSLARAKSLNVEAGMKLLANDELSNIVPFHMPLPKARSIVLPDSEVEAGDTAHTA